MAWLPTREEAFALLTTYNQEPFHIAHAQTVSGVLRQFALTMDPDRVDFWDVVGLLHDLDFERFPDRHCVAVREILSPFDPDPAMVHAIVSHGWGMTDGDVEPTAQMEKVLFGIDELTGLIGAAARMRPSGSCQDMELSSLKKKFRTVSFAAGCSRETIQKGAELLGWSLDELLTKTLDAMKTMGC